MSNNTHTMTDLQKAMLKDIQEGESDGIGMGYSEFDGIGLTPEEKGVLGSLVAEGYVYNSHEGDPYIMEPMYCSTRKAPLLIDESIHDRTIKKNPQKIEAVCNNLADAKYEMYQAIDTLKEVQSDDMAARLSDVLYELQQVLDKAYEIKTEAEEQA